MYYLNDGPLPSIIYKRLFHYKHKIYKVIWNPPLDSYRAFHGFGQAKFPKGGLVLGEPVFNTAPASCLQKYNSIQKWSKSTQK